jgi:hypothetical protein
MSISAAVATSTITTRRNQPSTRAAVAAPSPMSHSVNARSRRTSETPERIAVSARPGAVMRQSGVDQSVSLVIAATTKATMPTSIAATAAGRFASHASGDFGDSFR